MNFILVVLKTPDEGIEPDTIFILHIPKEILGANPTSGFNVLSLFDKIMETTKKFQITFSLGTVALIYLLDA